MLENPNFEQDYYARAATGIYKTGHDSVRLLKWLAYFDRSCCENKKYYDLVGSVLISLNDLS